MIKCKDVGIMATSITVIWFRNCQDLGDVNWNKICFSINRHSALMDLLV